MDTPAYNPDGSVNKTIETYSLNKKQAIAIGAKLNNKLKSGRGINLCYSKV